MRQKTSRRANGRSRLAKGRSGPGGDIGALALSYVVILPVFLAGIMVIVQASTWYLARQAALAAARHGADVARTANPPPGSGAQAAVNFATSAAPGFLLRPAATVLVSADHTVTVTVTGRAPSLVPGLPIHISEVVTAPVERFVAAGRLAAVGWSAGVHDYEGKLADLASQS
jgi:Flp pilus assembly protein TadG